MRPEGVLVALAAVAGVVVAGRPILWGALAATWVLGATALVSPVARRRLAPFLVAAAALAVVLVAAELA